MPRTFNAAVIALLITLLAAGSAVGGDEDGAGIRLGIGTDMGGGIAYGGDIHYSMLRMQNAIELGLNLFGGSFEESTDEGNNTYDETTDIFVVGVLVNYLFNYSMDNSGVYFVFGTGVGVVSVEWEERSATDTSLGTPLPGGGSMQAEDGSGAGIIFNLGIGKRFTEKFDARLQVPTLLVTSAPGDASAVVPMVSATVGISF